jgi:hypothetical protein
MASCLDVLASGLVEVPIPIFPKGRRTSPPKREVKDFFVWWFFQFQDILQPFPFGRRL